jgi:uncharacterized membrane protein
MLLLPNVNISNSKFFATQANYTLYASVMAFLTYSFVYALRKPFTAFSYNGFALWGINYKVCLVVCQLVGYTASKFYGIRFISSLYSNDRKKIFFILIAIAWASLLFFALIPPPYNSVFLLINGFPLGITWGIVYSYLEGRRNTDFTAAMLSISFIFSSGFVKSIAKFLKMHFGVSEFMAPLFTASIFIIPLVCCITMLEKMPPPNQKDINERQLRVALNKDDRRQILKTFFPALPILIGIYVLLTIFRDMRDNFMADMLTDMGYGNNAAVFSLTEILVTVAVVAVTASMVLVRSNIKGFSLGIASVILGLIVAGVSSFLFYKQMLSPFWWVTLTGMGLYAAYIPFNCNLFERLIAAFKLKGNNGFLMYLADSFGYLGSLFVLLFKEFFFVKVKWVTFFSGCLIIFSVVGILVVIISYLFFIKKFKTIGN